MSTFKRFGIMRLIRNAVKSDECTSEEDQEMIEEDSEAYMIAAKDASYEIVDHDYQKKTLITAPIDFNQYVQIEKREINIYSNESTGLTTAYVSDLKGQFIRQIEQSAIPFFK